MLFTVPLIQASWLAVCVCVCVCVCVISACMYDAVLLWLLFPCS